MLDDTSYIKNVEKYFLDHAGKGLMLSSIDYELILNWEQRGIPLDIVFKGIKNAFTEEARRISYNPNKLKSLDAISVSIEESFELYLLNKKYDDEPKLEDNQNYLDNLLISLNTNIKDINDQRILECLQKFKLKLLNDREDLFNDILRNSIIYENELYRDIYDSLSTKEKKLIMLEVKDVIYNSNLHMTDTAYEKSKESHRNSVLKKLYNIYFLD